MGETIEDQHFRHFTTPGVVFKTPVVVEMGGSHKTRYIYTPLTATQVFETGYGDDVVCDRFFENSEDRRVIRAKTDWGPRYTLVLSVSPQEGSASYAVVEICGEPDTDHFIDSVAELPLATVTMTIHVCADKNEQKTVFDALVQAATTRAAEN